MSDTTKLSYSEVNNPGINGARISARTIDDDGLGGVEKKVDIIAKEKQINMNIEIYYIPKQEKNPNDTKQNP